MASKIFLSEGNAKNASPQIAVSRVQLHTLTMALLRNRSLPVARPVRTRNPSERGIHKPVWCVIDVE